MADDININIGSNPSGVEAGSRRAKAAVNSVTGEAKQLDAAFRRLQSAIDPTFAAQERYNQSLRDNRALFAAGRIGGEEFAAGMRAARQELDAAREAAVRNTAAFKAQQAQLAQQKNQEAQAAREAAAAAKQAAREKAQAEKQAAQEAAAAVRQAKREEQEAIRAAATAAKQAAREKAQAERQAAREGVEALKAAKREERAAIQAAAAAAKTAAREKREADRLATAAAREAAAAERERTREAASSARTAMALRAAIDPAFASQMRYNDTMATATRLLMDNKLKQGEWIRIQQQAKAQMDINVRSLGRFNSSYVQLGYQAQDVTASLASGINPMVILAQQGGQTAAALSMMGGTVGKVAAFFAGPWGAAILGAVFVLGMLIPKLFDAASASDRMARSQDNLKNYIDETTGAIKKQITETQRLEAMKNAQSIADEKRKDVDKARAEAARKAFAATVPQAMTTGVSAAVMPAQISEKNIQVVRKLSEGLKEGKYSLEEFNRGLRNLGQSDPTVAKLAGRLQTLTAEAQDTQQEIAVAEAEVRLWSDAATEADKKLLGLSTSVDTMSQSYLNAQAVIKSSTDEVAKARARQSIAEADAERTRKKALADGTDQAKANQAYVDSVAPFVAATERAEEAASAASKAVKDAAKDEKAAIEEAFRFKMESYDYEREAANDNFQEQVRIQREKIEAIRTYHGAESNEYVRAKRELQRIERRHNEDLRRIQQDQLRAKAEMQELIINAERQASKEGFGMSEDTLSTMNQVGMIDGRPLIEARRQVLEEQYQMELDFENRIFQLRLSSLQAQVALYPEMSRERAALNADIEVLQAQHEARMAGLSAQHMRAVNRINLDVVQNTVNKWKTVTDSVGQSLSQMFQGIWMHSNNFKQNLLNIADQLVFKFVDAGLKIAGDWIANEAAKTAASLMGNQVRTASAAAAAGQQQAVGAAAATAEIGSRAATAAAGAYSSTVVIPFIGPVAAPAAAALALAAVMGFGALISAKGGLGEVPGDQLAMVHKKEMILPAWIAEPLRNSLRNTGVRSSSPMIGGAMAGADARAATHMSSAPQANFYYQPQNTNNNADLESMLRKDGRTFRKWIRNQARNGAYRMGDEL